MSPVIRAERLTRRYGSFTALQPLTIDVEEGRIVGLIGPSGGGKTTAVKLLAGVDSPSSGSVEVFGRSSRKLTRRERGRMALLAQDPALVEEFSIADQVRFAARLRSGDVDRVHPLLDRLKLGDKADTLLRDASGGMRRRAGLAASLVNDPDLLFLDEPTAGLDPIVREDIWSLLRERRRDGRTLVVTTQHIDEASRCDRVLVLRSGRVIVDCEPADLAEEAGITEAVVLTVRGGDASRAAASLQNASIGASVATTDDRTVRVETRESSVTANEIVLHLQEAGIETVSIDTEAPDLDRVFRSLVENAG